MMTGNVKEDVSKTVQLSLSFLCLQRYWIAQRFGPFHVMSPEDR
jgi:hypothetical protein